LNGVAALVDRLLRRLDDTLTREPDGGSEPPGALTGTS
jgi:hypothetical protein